MKHEIEVTADSLLVDSRVAVKGEKITVEARAALAAIENGAANWTDPGMAKAHEYHRGLAALDRATAIERLAELLGGGAPPAASAETGPAGGSTPTAPGPQVQPTAQSGPQVKPTAQPGPQAQPSAGPQPIPTAH